ncbi:MAG: hypothetical protein QOG43_2756 [Actinomycetota bacterium]|nr:hypothetical protein [Actinomycetota bacterium]
MARTMSVRSRGGEEHPLLEVLRRLDESGLAALLEARPDLLEPPPHTLPELAARALAPASVEICRHALDHGARQVLEALCLLPSPTTLGALIDLLRIDDLEAAADLADVTGRLCERALVARHGDRLQLLVRPEVPHPAGLGPPVRVALASQPAAVLEACADRLGVGGGATKAATLANIGKALATPGLLIDLLTEAPEGAAEVAASLAFGGPEGRAAGALYAAARSDHTPIGWLLSRGVLAPISWDSVVLVGEAGLALRGGRAFPDLALRAPEFSLQPVDAAAADRAAAERALRLVADITTILDRWAADAPKQLKAGGLGVQVVRRAAKVIDRAEVETARVVELAVAAGLVSIDAKSDSALPLPAYDQWSDLDVAGRWAHLVGAWLRWDLHLCLAGAVDTKRKPIPPMLVRAHESRAVARRRRVLETLAEIPPGHSVTVESLFGRATWDRPGLWASGLTSGEGLVTWSLLECELLGLTGLGGLSTWGRLVATGDIEGARAALDRLVPAATSQFVVQADLTALAPAELVRPVQAELESMADLESRGAAVLFRFTEASVRRCFEAGRTGADILAFLDAHAAKGVPQALRYLVNDVARRFGQVRVVATRCCLRSDDQALLAEVVASRAAARLGLRLLAPTVAAASADPPTVLAALRDAGYAPAEEGADGALVLRRPPRRRAVPDRRLAALTGRPSNVDAAFGPVGDPFAAGTAAAVGPAAAKAGAGPDYAATAARLLRTEAPAPKPPAPKPPAPKTPAVELPLPASVTRGMPPPVASAFDLSPAGGRPERIARDPAAVADLLQRALVEGWPVRMAYTNKKGNSTQLNAAVLDVGRREVIVELLSGWESRVLALSRVSWVRVLTEAEEDSL